MDIKKLLSEMTLKEKIGQLVQLGAKFFADGAGADETGPLAQMNVTEEEIACVGSTLNFMGADVMRGIQTKYLKTNRIPMLFMQDVLHGYRTIYPIPLGLGASFDTETVRECSAMAAKEAALGGVHVNFSPMVDLARDARWGRVMETTGEDPYLNSVMAKAMVEGFQGDMGRYNVAACTKHFAAYGAVEAGRDYNTVDVSRRTLNEFYLSAYKATVDAGVKMFMTAFTLFDGIPVTANKELICGILRGQWGFDGVIITDYNAVREMKTHGYVPDYKCAAQSALSAGIDVEMMSVTFIKYIEDLIKEGSVSEADIDRSVLRVLKLKDDLGLFENPFRSADADELERVALSEEHRSIACGAAERSAVLLKNDGLLPFSEDIKSVAVIGPHANTGEILGFWHCGGRFEDTVTVYDGIKKLVPNARVEYAEGCLAMLDSTDGGGIAEAVALAKRSEAVVLCLGEHWGDSGEGNSKLNLELPEIQYRLFEEVSKVNSNVAVLLFTGRPLAIGRLDKSARAILNMWFPGTEGGSAAANLLFGKVNPSGKLSMTFPACTGQCPIYYNHFNTSRPRPDDGRRYAYTSSYIDGPNRPLYPFGFGLSYTSFSISAVKLSVKAISFGRSLTASVTVKNTGYRGGHAVVQLYIRDKYASCVRPVKELKGFKKIYLNSGEEAAVEFTVCEDMLAFYHSDGKRAAEAGEFTVFIGEDSDTENCADFILTERL